MTMTDAPQESEGPAATAEKPDGASSASTAHASLLFRPSKLTPVADKMFENCKTKVEELHKDGKTAANLPQFGKKEPASKLSDEKDSCSSLKPAVSNGEPSAQSLKPAQFVFGRNIDERVTGKPDEPEQKKEGETEGEGKVEGEKGEDNGESSTSTSTVPSSAAQTTVTAATTTTGEEGERNIIQMTCKLHAYDKSTSEFKERGRGLLRLNKVPKDDATWDYRIVMRSEGRQRVILNSKLWPSMLLESASAKKIKLCATDPENDGHITLFVITASESDCQSLFSSLEKYLEEIKKRVESSAAAESGAENVGAQNVGAQNVGAQNVGASGAQKRKLDSKNEDPKFSPSKSSRKGGDISERE